MAGPHEGITNYMKEVFKTYDSLRGKSRKDGFAVPFWDLVILSTADEVQKVACELQIQEKLNRGELPKDVPYKVYSDPPGPKIGNGGAVFDILKKCYHEMKEDLFKNRILLIMTGGESRRLPTCSILGKIFMALPFGSPLYQMLDLKLAVFLPFLNDMASGIFITASDDIEVFQLDLQSICSFSSPGFTALAHPSTFEVGANHGVYVLPKPFNKEFTLTNTCRCSAVLQKPSVSVMKEKAAVNGINTILKSDEIVFSDSVFFFDHSITNTLLDFINTEKEISCEIDIYGDFLQALGPESTTDYVHNTKNVVSNSPSLIPTRMKLFNILKDSRLTVTSLNFSRFHHLGTIQEYLHHFSEDSLMFREIGFSKQAFSSIVPMSDQEYKRPKLETLSGCIIHSIVHECIGLANNSILEYCDFSSPIVIESNCILSNCYISAHFPKELIVVNGTILSTVAVDTCNEVKYATIVFDIKDDLKAKVSSQQADHLVFLGKNIKEVLLFFGKESLEKLFPSDEFCSLWTAKLFPLLSSMEESFKFALKMLNYIKKEKTYHSDLQSNINFVSVMEILKMKNVKEMINFRNTIYQKIKLSCNIIESH